MTIQQMFDLTGQVAVIIGGARDFGFYRGAVLAEAGCDLVLTSRNIAACAGHLDIPSSVRNY
jgi:NAD(P)-dependent dehydrogenase (short-subunit alcohol dehydrogenase family)